MEPISDLTWMQQILSGTVRERFKYDDYRAVALELPSSGRRKSPYHFRLLFFPKDEKKPILSLNVESSILGSYCLTEHAGQKHINLGPTEFELSYEKFKNWALKEAEKILD